MQQPDFVSGDGLISKHYFDPEKPALDLFARRGDQSAITVLSGDIENAHYSVPLRVKEDIRRISQLGLKEIWLGQSPADHNRWEHSLGAFNVGFIWLKAMEEDERVPKHCLVWPMDSWEKVRAIVGTALLLHDYGHLPFSHLLNETLESINWLPFATKSAGLEAAVLQHRAQGEGLKDTWSTLLNDKIGLGSAREIKTSDIRSMTEDLVLGKHAVPWLQAIVNSPIDADKIDYIRFDSAFLRATDYPIHSRLQEEKPTQWLTEFLRDQEVNHVGLICLHGRSALAASDLWRERIFLYDRFYLSPALRVPEKIAFEIVQQFIIHSTMRPKFLQSLNMQGLRSFSERFEAPDTSDITSGDPIDVKFQAVRETMLQLLEMGHGSGREFPILQLMAEKLCEFKGIDEEYREFLKRCFEYLKDLKEKRKKLNQVVTESLVREPLLLEYKDFDKARDVMRPLQHTYCREALIDIVRLPRVLSTPKRWRTGFNEDNKPGMDYSILVPDGPVSTWGPGRRATCPLTDECVKELERPYCRVSVIAPGQADSAKAAYIWDRVRSTLLEANLNLVKEMREAK